MHRKWADRFSLNGTKVNMWVKSIRNASQAFLAHLLNQLLDKWSFAMRTSWLCGRIMCEMTIQWVKTTIQKSLPSNTDANRLRAATRPPVKMIKNCKLIKYFEATNNWFIPMMQSCDTNNEIEFLLNEIVVWKTVTLHARLTRQDVMDPIWIPVLHETEIKMSNQVANKLNRLFKLLWDPITEKSRVSFLAMINSWRTSWGADFIKLSTRCRNIVHSPATFC